MFGFVAGKFALLGQSGSTDPRLRRGAFTALASMLSRAGNFLILLIGTPLAYAYLDAERFGVWMVASGFGAMAIFIDFGLGNGIMNRTAEAFGKGQLDKIREVASSGMVLMSAIAAVIIAATFAAYPFVDWPALLNAKSEIARAESGPTVAAFLICTALILPLSVVTKVQMGLQQGYAPQLWATLGGFLSFLGIVAAIHWDFGVPYLVASLYGAPLIALVSNHIYFFYFRRPDLRPNWLSSTSAEMRLLLHLGFYFFMLQLIAAITFRIDTLIVTQQFGAVRAGEYAIYERLFALATYFMPFFLSPLWPAYTEAFHSGDRGWVVSILRKSMIIAASVALIFAGLAAMFNRQIIDLWLGGGWEAPLALILGLMIWRVLEAVGSALAMAYNGLGLVRSQMWLALAMAIIATALKVNFGQQWGLASLVWITILCYLVLGLIPMMVIIKRKLAADMAPLQELGQ